MRAEYTPLVLKALANLKPEAEATPPGWGSTPGTEPGMFPPKLDAGESESEE